MKQYLVWATDFESRVDADVIKADTAIDAAQGWAQQRNSLTRLVGESTDLVTVVEDLTGALEDSYDVFCKLTYTAHKQRVVDVQA